MKKFESFAKAKKFVQLFLEGTFGAESFVLYDFAIDMKSVTFNHVIAFPRFLAVRNHGTQGVYLSLDEAKEVLSSWMDPYAVIEFSYIPEEHKFAVSLLDF